MNFKIAAIRIFAKFIENHTHVPNVMTASAKIAGIFITQNSGNIHPSKITRYKVQACFGLEFVSVFGWQGSCGLTRQDVLKPPQLSGDILGV